MKVTLLRSIVCASLLVHCSSTTPSNDAGADAAVDHSACPTAPDAGFFECPALCPAHFHEGSPCSDKGLLCSGGDPSPPCANVQPIHCTCDGTSFSCLVDCFDASPD